MTDIRFSRRFNRLRWGIPLVLLIIIAGAATIVGLRYARSHLFSPSDAQSASKGQGPVYHPIDLEKQVAAWASGVTTLLASDGSKLGELRLERCFPVDLEVLPPFLIDAFILAEEKGICSPENPGTLTPLMTALEDNLEAGVTTDDLLHRCTTLRHAAFGPSPTTCESWLPLARGEYLSLEDPSPIREAYLNLVDFGDGDYGVEAGAWSWFRRSAASVDPAQAALLAVVATRPELRASLTRLRKERDALLRRLEQQGQLLPKVAAAARATPVSKRRPYADPASSIPSFMNGVQGELGRYLEDSYARRVGMQVHTTFDPGLQAAAGKAVEKVLKVWTVNRKKEAEKLSEVLEKLGTDAADLPLEDVPPGSLFEIPDGSPSVGVMAMDTGTGRVRVMLDVCEDAGKVARKKTEDRLKNRRQRGGPEHSWTPCAARDIQKNGVMRRRRQPGSAWKPLLYATALEQGLMQADTYLDAPLSYMVKNELWSPKNHEERYYKRVIARRALAHSINSVAVQLMFKVGPERVAHMAERLGIRSRIHAVPALALGTSPVTLGELVQAYAVLPSGGHRVIPRYIDRILNNQGHPVAWPVFESGAEVLDPRVAYVLTDMLRETTTSGTAWPAKRLKFPVAGKTGTTNLSQDAWFLGYSSQMVAGVWIGFDERTPLGGKETGGSLALPVWMELMAKAAKANPPGEFEVPPGVRFEVRSPWNGKLDEKGKSMAFIAPVRPSCNEPPPDDALSEEVAVMIRDGMPPPRKTSAERRALRLKRERNGCDWTPVQRDTIAQGSIDEE